MESNIEQSLKRNEDKTANRLRILGDLENRFKWHAPKDISTANKHATVRDTCLDLAITLLDNVPDGREKALAFTKLEEVMMWANAGIARNG